MDKFLRDNKKFLLSTLWLVFGVAAYIYATTYSNAAIGLKDLNIARSKLQSEQQELEKTIQRQSEDMVKTEEGISSISVFLNRINEVAKSNRVILRRLNPQDKELTYSIEIIEDYYTFLHFTAQLESLDVSINDMQIRPYDMSTVPPKHFITFSISAKNNAQTQTGHRLKELEKIVTEKDKRNPFQRFAFQKGEKVERNIDLTWIKRLSGIGRTSDGKYYATIDNRDYFVGDLLSGKEVSRILKDRVLLKDETDDAIRQFIIKFRKKKRTK